MKLIKKNQKRKQTLILSFDLESIFVLKKWIKKNHINIELELESNLRKKKEIHSEGLENNSAEGRCPTSKRDEDDIAIES